MLNLALDEDSALFHTINRNKESFAADLKDPTDLESVRQIIARADVLIQNFRPGVMERIGLGYEDVRKLNPRIVYAEVSGYGTEGPWLNRPGQDLLAQAVSGITWLNGDEAQGPVPIGISIADVLAGAHLAQGILACLLRRATTGEGGRVEVSLLESILDLQFEEFTTFLNDGGRPPARSASANAHAYLGAPYGVYAAADGFLAIAMTPIPRLGELLGCEALLKFSNPSGWVSQRDEIKALVAAHLAPHSVAHWLAILTPADVWCAEVLSWDDLVVHEGFLKLDMLQAVKRPGGASLTTTRCPIRIDGQILKSDRPAPRLGEDTIRILDELTGPD
jgi:crotonobetainyl-CoA:carnitine CoA-transferase CaiB-like acyl-CoA transferase